MAIRQLGSSSSGVESFPPLPLRPPAAKYKRRTVLLKNDLNFRKYVRRWALLVVIAADLPCTASMTA
jgi:hypothetical protein